jgi:hypothetical protein
MKQKMIIGLSIVLLLLAVFLISHDLFRSKPLLTESCCDDEIREMKQIDTTQLGFYRSKLWETGMKGLTGISVSDNRVVVCGNKMIAVFDTMGTRIGSFSIDSASTCVAVYDNDIFTGIGSGAAKYDFAGRLTARFNAPSDGSYITSITANSEFVFMADAGRRRILKFTKSGNLLQEIGKKDSISGFEGFVIPSPYFDIAYGGFNDLWIVNPGKLQLENFSISGKKRSDWGEELADDYRFTGCCNPAHFALLPDGSFVTYEKGNDKIKVFDPTGKFRGLVAGAGSFKGKPDFLLGRNNLVKDIATDQSGRIYILDAYNRINIFKEKAIKDT